MVDLKIKSFMEKLPSDESFLYYFNLNKNYSPDYYSVESSQFYYEYKNSLFHFSIL